MSTKLIAERARVSRGAITHQFATKNDILVAAYEFLLSEWEREWPFGRTDASGFMDVEDFVESLWDHLFSTNTYLAALELMLAARLDVELGKGLRAALARWGVIRDAHSSAVLGIADGDERAEQLVRLNLCMLRGIAVNQFFDQGPHVESELISLWKEVLQRELKTHLRRRSTGVKPSTDKGTLPP